MRWPRRYGLWITLAFLALLLFLLGALQYRWIGEIGRADSERRQVQLDRSARRFAAGLERELGQVMMTLRLAPGSERDRRELLSERLSAWSKTEHAPLVTRVSLLSLRPDDEVTLETCGDGSRCQPGTWTPQLERLRRRLLAAQDARGGPTDAAIRPGEMLEAPLGLLFPVVEIVDQPPSAERWGRFRVQGLVAIELDEGYLGSKVLPQLAELSFGPLRESEFALSVVRRSDRAPLYASDPAAAPGSLPADLELPVPDFRRQGPDEPRGGGERRFSEWLFRGAPTPGRGPGGPPPAEAPWLLVVRHHGGSLEHAVAAIRRRNLAISGGVLALLGAAAILLAIGAQRARDLARQQLELVASVSHELNTPLAAIRSAGQNLAHGIITDPAQVQRYGTLIEHEGSRLTGLVAQVLDFAGIQSGSRPYASEPVSLARVVDDVLADLRLVLEQSGLSVSKNVPAALPELLGDAAALRRVVANLLTNAVKFAAAGGRVAISAELTPEGGALVLRVEDAGPGIPAAERARVFEPFYRGAAAQRNDSPGAGLGLALVRRVATAHGGRARIESALGGGTAVVVELPLPVGTP